MGWWSNVRDTVENVGSAVAVGLPAAMISSGAAAATAVAGAAGLGGVLGGNAPIPAPSAGGGNNNSSSQGDLGPQQNLASLMQMVGAQQPTMVSGAPLVGGGGLI